MSPSAGLLESEGSCENQGRFLEGGDVDLGLEGCQRFEYHMQKRWRWEVKGVSQEGRSVLR